MNIENIETNYINQEYYWSCKSFIQNQENINFFARPNIVKKLNKVKKVNKITVTYEKYRN